MWFGKAVNLLRLNIVISKSVLKVDGSKFDKNLLPFLFSIAIVNAHCKPIYFQLEHKHHQSIKKTEW